MRVSMVLQRQAYMFNPGTRPEQDLEHEQEDQDQRRLKIGTPGPTSKYRVNEGHKFPDWLNSRSLNCQ